MAVVMRAVDLGRTLRSQAGINLRQPIRSVWLALPPGATLGDGLFDILADELNARSVALIADDSELIERRVRPLLPQIGKRLGAQTQAVLAAARANEVEYLSDGGVSLAGVELAADEVEILATPRPGTAVAHDEGLVVVIDTDLDDDLRAEGDARELSRAVQDLRKQAGLELDDTIDLWLTAPETVRAALASHLEKVAEDTLAAAVHDDSPPSDAMAAEQQLNSGTVRIALRRHGPAA